MKRAGPEEHLPTRDWLYFVSVLLAASVPLGGQQREPVLRQVDVPHRYYYREMYLPQVTTGPSAEAWTPDSRALIYSMAGSLWRQNRESRTTEPISARGAYEK